MSKQLFYLLTFTSLIYAGCSSTKKSSDNGAQTTNNKNIKTAQESVPAAKQEAKPAKMEQKEILYDK